MNERKMNECKNGAVFPFEHTVMCLEGYCWFTLELSNVVVQFNGHKREPSTLSYCKSSSSLCVYVYVWLCMKILNGAD